MWNQDIQQFCDNILKEGLEHLDLSVGIVSHIEQDTYSILAAKSPDNAFKHGDRFPLRNTYCKDVVARGKTMALTELGGFKGLCQHPLYTNLPLESYISTPIFLNQEIWGTLNFSSMKIRDHKFNAEEISYIEKRAKVISTAISEIKT